MHGIRVQLATTKVACKNCGREYAPIELASLSVCESCGIALVPDGIAAETSQCFIVEKDNATSNSSDAMNYSTAKLEARISVKRFEIKDSLRNHGGYAMSMPACVQPPPRASWIKVA